MKIKSPITNSTNVQLVRKISTAHIIELYFRLGLDVRTYFENLTEIEIYRCNDSALRFFSPSSIAGDFKFYEDLEKKYKNYYANWKWEHKQVSTFIKNDMKVLEIGCAHGSFLTQLNKMGVQTVVGLELNNHAVIKAKESGLDVRNELIENHKLTNSNFYDFVCSFQVVEHISELHDFIHDSLLCLKKGGLFSISVPNNDCYLYSNDADHVLNLPPHHMGLWDENALKKLAVLFDLEVISIFKEPANTANYGSYYEVFLRNTIGFKGNLLKGFYKLTRPFVKMGMKILPPKYGACITVIYKKK